MPTHAFILESAQKMQKGVKKHLSKAKNLTLNGQTYTPAQVQATLQAVIDTSTASDGSKADYLASVDAKKKAATAAVAVIAGLTAYAYLNYGNSKSMLADFGIAPLKKRKPSAKTKAGAQMKAAATREARGTKGKRQREKIVATSPTAVTNGASINGAAGTKSQSTGS